MADGIIGIKITGDASGLQQSLQGAGREVDAFGGKLRDNADAMAALANGFKSAFLGSSIAVGIIGLKNTFVDLTKALVEAQIQADKLRNGLNFAVGRGNAASEIDFIRSSAKNLGLEFVTTAAQYTKLAAAARDTGLQGQKVRDVFTSVAQASTVMGLSAQETEGALLAITQMISKGKVQAEELRGQLGERLPGAFQIAAEAMGVTTGELDKMLQTGTVLADDFLPRFAAVLTRKTAPEVAEAAKSMQASVNLMSNAWTEFKQTFADGALAQSVSGGLRTFSASLNGISENLDLAKKNGGGFFRQFVQLTGDSLAAFLPFVDAPRTLAVQLDEANKKVAALHKSMATADGYERDFLRKEIQSTEDWIVVLADALAKKRELLAGSAGGNASPVEDRRFAASAAAEQARKSKLTAQQAAYSSAMSTYATPGESLTAELKKQKDALGDLFTPELERRIREHFIKPVKDSSDASKGLKLYSDLIGKSGGYAADYAEKVGYLSAAYATGKIKLTDLQAALGELNAEQKINIQAAKDQADATKGIIKAYEEEVKAHHDRIKELDRSAATEATRMQKLQDEEKAAGIAAAQNISLAVAIEEVGLARVREAYAAEAAKNADGQTLLALQNEIAAREKIITLLGDKEARTASQEAAKKAAEDWKKTADQIESSITDALMRGFENGKDFATNLRDTIVNMFKTMVLKPVVSAIVSPVAAAFTSTMGVSTAANAATAASAASGSSILSSLGGWFSDFQLSATNSIYEIGGALTKMGAESLGSIVTQNATALGSFINTAGYAFAAVSAIDAASKGQWGSAIGTGVGAYFGGPLGAALGGAVGGWVDSAFGGGHEYTTGSGITGTFSKSGFSGRNYQTWRNDGSGGFFGIGGSGASSGTNYSGMSTGASNELGRAFASIQFAASAMAVSLGLDAQKVLDFSKSITVALSSDAEANKKVITDLMAGVANDIASAIAPSIGDFAKSGETSSATLARLSSSIITTNAWLSMLRLRLYDVSLAGADAASSLADAFGGLDQLASSSKAYYDAYYTNSEKVAASQNAMTLALLQYGFALPTTKAALRSMVESLDLTTESGRTAYAALLKLAPQFSETAALMDQMATEAATAILATFTANGRLVPALNAAGLSLQGVQTEVTAFTGGITQVHAVLLDASSPVLEFGGTVQTLSAGLTGAQRSALDLYDQIDSLSGASSKAAIDFDGLSGALAKLDTTTFVATIGLVFDKLATRITGVIDSITTERVAVREAALAIINPSVMSKQSIMAGIAGINTALPSNAGLIAANSALGAANTAQTQAQDKLSSANAALIDAKSKMASDVSRYQGLSSQFSSIVASVGGSAWASDGGQAYGYNASANRFNDWANASWPSWGAKYNAMLALRGSNYYSSGTAASSIIGQLSGEGGAVSANDTLAANETAIAAATAAIASGQSAVASATTAQATAAKTAAQALVDYQRALQGFAIDASKSVGKLSKLREETVKYYEAQKALADLMATSAAGLRSTVAGYRYNQLSAADQAASLQAQFATAYAMAQATQGDGSTLASYADKLNSTLGPLLDKLTETGQTNLIASYLAQAESVAKLLEDNAPKNYQADSLAMLGNIDATLAALDESAKSAEQVISDAVAAGSDRTAAGLYAVIAAITGQPVPKFATGAAFGGGVVKRPSLFNMGQMGEAGPEAIMPLANVGGSLGVRMAGGGFDAVVAELQALRTQVENMSAETRSTALSSIKTTKLLERVTEGGESMKTVAV